MVMGHSMGAGVASILTGSMPSIVDGCICIEGLGAPVFLPIRRGNTFGTTLSVHGASRPGPSGQPSCIPQWKQLLQQGVPLLPLGPGINF